MPGAHRDPFDRMLVAQALTEGFGLVSNELVLGTFGVTRVW
jgi:PIN domain nuclease of toxin-antitoxin system